MPFTNVTAEVARTTYLGSANEQGIRDAAKAITGVGTDIVTLSTGVTKAINGVVGVSWTTAAANSFGRIGTALTGFLTTVAVTVADYALLNSAADRLVEARSIVGNAPADAIADVTLNSLATNYVQIRGQLGEIPTDPQDVSGGGTDDPNGNTEDEKKDDKEKDDKEKDDGEQGGGGSGSGGGPEATPELGDSGGGSGEDPSLGGEETPGLEGSGGGGAGDPGLGDEEAGGLGGDGEQGSGGGVGPGGGVLPPLTDSRRDLPGAPKVTGRDGVTGIDVDGDGRPDLGLDGKPLPGAELITRDGLTGIDVDGDGRPDIGVDGELLPGAPIVEGPDGTIGIDVNGDGVPDVGISGQILADAPVVEANGVRGIDVNGDGIADLGMDRRPLPTASLVTVDGVTGVDVNDDGRPDIGVNGEILDGAPMVTGANGLVGVDVNNDGRPDIAATGGLKADRDAGAGTTRPAGLSPALSAAGQTVTRGYEVTDPPTTLAASGARTSPVLAGAARVPAEAMPGFGPMPGMLMGGGAGMGMGGGDLGAELMPHRVALVEADDTWADAVPRSRVLGREEAPPSWEEQQR